MTRAREADPRPFALNAGRRGPRQAARLVDCILKKAQPQDVPTEQQEALEIGTIPAVFLLVG
jgi:hypothetical protein